MPDSADERIADDLLAYQLDLFRLEANTQSRTLQSLEALTRELTRRLGAEDLTTFTKQRTQRLLREANAIISDYYTRITNDVTAISSGSAHVQARQAVDSINAASTPLVFLEAALPPASVINAMAGDAMLFGAPSAQWWRRQSGDTQFRFANAVREGLLFNETNQQIVNRVAGSPTLGRPGVMDISKHAARALVQTSVQTVANDAKLEVFSRNADIILGVRQLSTLDGKTSDICIAYSGDEWDLTGKPLGKTKLPFNGGPPRHWNCRSVLVPITKRIPGLATRGPGAMRASIDGPVSQSTTFNAFLKRKGKAFQDETLGPGRADLWRRGKITLSQLLDLRGNPMTLAQLRRKYDRRS